MDSDLVTISFLPGNRVVTRLILQAPEPEPKTTPDSTTKYCTGPSFPFTRSYFPPFDSPQTEILFGESSLD